METEKTTVSNHYYQGGINFIGCHLPNATFQTLNPRAQDGAAPPATAPATATPACLDTPEANELLRRLVQAGLLDERWQPCNLSQPQRGVLAWTLADKLRIAHVWKTFGALWGTSPDTLRTKYNEGMNQKRMGEFMSLINNLLQ